ncbi:type IV secretory system conjugative DNA transfer family protein [Actinacidiphila acidipaludis]|uniref:Type IV secretory system conjugative DNA transfer family protein n=1 Tax=Actinacidiphila acidipaludis TaxID=2873382 RepID=A0ABS7QHZ7_9ACTN|nr:type IV secretory system conjugative DNA transfer family protein [Streptomyces acidipaludis]MBY8882775.1 type IV secretory system conjugative DNA transfer family protein [Streptomyces acidipaludis]
MARRKDQPGGLPDGLIVAVIGLLLGVTLLVWTATGISGLFAHGSWPSDVHFTRTPVAMRSLVADPHDMPAAWPGARAGELSGSGLFWGVFISQILVLIVLAVWVLGVVSRLRNGGRDRGRRPARTAARGRQQAAEFFEEPEEDAPEPAPVPRPRAGAAAARDAAAAKDDASLDAWFRTVPQATPPGTRDDAPTSELTPVGGESAPAGATTGAAATGAAEPAANHGDRHAAALAGCEVTRTYVLFADARSDKAKRVVQPAVLAAEGPVVVTTADPDTYQQTVGNRAKLGPVHVYDPGHLLDVPGRLRWAPHDGCADPRTAGIRSAALLAPLRTARADEAIVHDTAATLLRCWLHAAAVDGQPFRQIHRWAAGGAAAGEAVRILRTDTGAASGWSGELESVVHAHPERRDAAQALIRRVLEPLNAVHFRDACNPGRNGGLDLESFASERGTLYVVGERIEDPRSHPGAMPLLTALVSCVVEHGRRMAAGSSAGRLDPPLTFLLDDVAALAPLPELPELLSTGHAAGLPTLAVVRSPEQALARWRAPLWQAADLRLVLGAETAAALPPSVPDAVRLP